MSYDNEGEEILRLSWGMEGTKASWRGGGQTRLRDI